MGVEVMGCCGALTRVYSQGAPGQEPRRHNPWCHTLKTTEQVSEYRGYALKYSDRGIEVFFAGDHVGTYTDLVRVLGDIDEWMYAR